MSHFYGYIPQLETSLNLEPVISWLAIITIGLIAYSIAKAIQYLNRTSE
jgi:hypothetical protein